MRRIRPIKIAIVGQRFVRHELDHILHLPVVARITHPSFRRPLVVMGAGVCLMLGGSTLSVSANFVCHHVVPVPHVVVDAVAYFTHGVGAIPFVRYLEPLVTVLMGADPNKKEN